MKKCIFYIYFLPAFLFFLSCSNPNNTEEKPAADGKLSPEESLEALHTAEGLEVTLFASEPLFSNPTNIDVDARGRVWVTEARNYRNQYNPDNPYRTAGDRIVILEDTNADGKADTGKVFYQDTLINSALGIAVLGNKVIVSCSPNVWILTDTNHDDKADKKELLFTGIGGKQHDHSAHAFVFGPDGKLYFNFGNEGKAILDKNGNPIKDKQGRVINDEGNPYRQGMAFRCNPDGSELEVIGHNFRNPYELAVDSYGAVWQTDNDDDGNRSTRVNYLMEYGNYGYTDASTGASWQEWRINREDSIPLRHWHQTDPGVVPNLLVNGSGSPSGLCIYEGDLLPAPFRGQMIHAEAGHNAVRAYPVTADGAGYKAKRINLLFTGEDKWFRPVDVCVAPDGSLLVADWYDPGVGGHRAGDVKLGRIYRVAPEDKDYKTPSFSMNTPAEAVKALQSPNQATRYLAWNNLHELGKEAETELDQLFTSSGDPRQRGRALWLLTKIPGSGPHYLRQALEDENADIRMSAVRAARQMDTDLAAVIRKVTADPSPQVRRTALIALRSLDIPEAPALWAELASRFKGKDPWYLEALGIAAEGRWDACFAAWLEKAEDWNTPAGRKIVWRSGGSQSLPMLASMASAGDISDMERRRIFRAFAFHENGPRKQEALMSLIKGTGNKNDTNKTAAYALMMTDPASVPRTEAVMQALEKSLRQLKGQPEYLQLIARFELKNKANELIAISLDTAAGEEMRENALQALLDMQLAGKISAVIDRDDEKALLMTGMLGKADGPEVNGQLQRIIQNRAYSRKLREQAVNSLGNSWNGSESLMTLVEKDKLPGEFDTLAQKILTSTWRPDVLARAKAFYSGGQANAGQAMATLPDINTLMAAKGNAGNGAKVFASYCSSCHVVNGKGIQFGPELSEIGSKLSKEAMFDAVIHPDNGINFGFEGYTFHLNDGTSLTGYIASEASGEVSLKIIGGQTRQLKTAEIQSREASRHSLMPSGLGEAMGKQQLTDLVAYLGKLKKAE